MLVAVLYAYGFYWVRLPTVEQQLNAEDFRRIDVLAFVGSPDLFPSFFLDRWFGAPRSLGMIDRLAVLFWAAAILAFAATAGWLLLMLVRLDERLDRLETFVFSIAVGLGVTSTYVLAVGLLGWLRNPLAYAVPAALVIAAAGRQAAGRLRATAVAASAGEATVQAVEPFGPRWLGAALPFAAIVVLGGMLPPVDFDVREYHLQAPKEWYEQGQITFLPHNVYGNMPAGAGMFSLLGMGVTGDWWRGALVGKTVIALLPLVTALGLLAAGRRLFSTSAGVVAALVYVSTPWILRVSTDGLVEGFVGMNTLLALYAAVLWKNNLADNGRADDAADSSGCGSVGGPWGFVLLAGYLAGAAVAVKYPPALFLVMPLGIWFGVFSWKGNFQRGTNRKSARDLPPAAEPRTRGPVDWKSVLLVVGAFLLAAALGCGLWLGKNWVLTGNPTYPLLYEVFGGASWTPAQNAQWNAVHRPHDFSPATLGDDLGRVVLRSEWLSPLLFPLALLAVLDRRNRRLVLGLAGYCAFVIAAWWLVTHRIDRFWVPILSVVALLAGVGACLRPQRPYRLAMATLLLLGLGMNLLTALTVGVRYQAYGVDLARLRRDPARLDPWHLVLNARWDQPDFNPHGPDAHLMAVGDAEVFDLDMPVDYATCFDDCPLETVVKGRTVDEIREALRRRRTAMIYVHWGEIQRYQQTYGFTDFVRPEVLDELVAQGIVERLPALGEHPGRVYRVK